MELEQRTTKLSQFLLEHRSANGLVDLSGVTLPNHFHLVNMRRNHLEKFGDNSIVHLCLMEKQFNVLVRTDVNTIPRLGDLIENDQLGNRVYKSAITKRGYREIGPVAAQIITKYYREWIEIRSNYSSAS